MLAKLFKQKLIIGLILVLILAGSFLGYKALKSKKEKTRYILAEVKKGTVVVSVSGSGQISAQEQIDIKPKISGVVSAILVKKGEEVKRGRLIMKLDDTDFQKAVKDAEYSLKIAKIELEKLLEPPDKLSLLQAENSLAQAKEAKQKAEEDLQKAYEDGFNTAENIILGMPSLISFISKIPSNQWGMVRGISYDLILSQHNKLFEDFKKTSKYSDKETLDSLFDEVYEMIRNLEAVIRVTDDITYINQVNTYLSNIVVLKRTIQQYKEAVSNAERTVAEKTVLLEKLKAGPDELDVQAKKILVQQKEDNLLNARENLAKCYIYAPLDGIISDVQVKKGDSVSFNTPLAALVTKQKIAEISLNEVDVAKVKIDQEATLSFDAIEGLTILGRIIDIDVVGTVSQGVVSYGIKIALDTQDERIKPGMSVTANIITEIKQDVLVLPNSAIKSRAGSYYVELVEVPQEKREEYLANKSGVILPTPPKIQQVEVGVSNESLTEILSGLKEGDIVISSTLNPAQIIQTRRSQQFQIPGMGNQQTRFSR